MTKITEFAIVKEIMKKLKLDDAGKMSKFITNEISASKEDIEAIEMNLQTAKLAFEHSIKKLNRELEDAKGYVTDAYRNITPEDVYNNAACARFSEVYRENIKQCEARVVEFEKTIKSTTDAYEIEVKELNEDIDKHNDYIAKISVVAE